MTASLGRGLLGSLAARIRAEVGELFRDNKVMRRARHPLMLRLARGWLVDRSLLAMLLLYAAFALVLTGAEVAILRFAPYLWLDWHGDPLRAFLKDVTSYFIAAQIGILAIVSVAVAVVTLLSQDENAGSVNTDVRLYYVSSYAYELVTSSVALLVVLTVQLFWPLEFLVQGLGWGGQYGTPPEPGLLAQAIMTGVHTIWQAFNLLLFLHFTTTTLRFVEPSTREAMREAYSANQVIPDDVASRLGGAMNRAAANHLFEKAQLEEGPQVTFGYSYVVEEETTDEIVLHFATAHVLKDIKLRPLRWALASWRRRVQRKPQKRSNNIFGGRQWEGELVLPITINQEVVDRVVLLQREKGVPLLWWEKLVIRQSYRFARRRRRGPDPLTPSDFLEGLTDKVLTRVEKDAVTGFKAAFREVTNYHSFILAAQNTRDEAGQALNLAEVGGVWSRPDEEWIRQYRRVFDAAAGRLGDTTEYMDWLCYLPSRLLPDDRDTISPRVLKSIVDLGIYWVLALEGWITRHSLPSWTPSEPSSARLAGTDQNAFERTLVEFTGAWESLLGKLRALFKPERRHALAQPARWRALTLSWPSVEAHLEATAFFVTYATWNEDEAGAQRFRDMLLRWPNKFYEEVQNLHVFKQVFLLTPDFLSPEWEAAEQASKPRQRMPDFDRVQPEGLFGAVVLYAHEDVVTICAALALLWHAEKQLETPTGATTALGLLRREMIVEEGSDLIQHLERRTPFRLAFNLLVRRGLNPAFGEAGFGAGLDRLVRQLSGIASRRMVPGRGYSGWGLEGVDTVKRPLLAIMAAFLPAQADDGVVVDVTAMLEAGGPLADNDALRSFKFYVEQLIVVLGAEVDESFARCIHALVPDLDPEEARFHLEALLKVVIDLLREAENARRTAPLDEAAIAKVRLELERRMLANGPTLPLFSKRPRRRGSESPAIQTPSFGEIDRGAFLNPPYSGQTAEDLGGTIVDFGLRYLGQFLRNALLRLPRRLVAVPPNDDPVAFWRAVVAHKDEVGAEPTVLVPFDIAYELRERQHFNEAHRLDEFKIEYLENMPSGDGFGYMGTLEDIHVYSVQDDANRAILFAQGMLEAIDYGVVHEGMGIADFEFFGDVIERSQVRFSFAQQPQWKDPVVIEFRKPVRRRSKAPNGPLESA